MPIVTVSTKFQVVIPVAIRRSMRTKAGQKVQVISYKNRVELIPIQPLKTMRGFLKGIDTAMPSGILWTEIAMAIMRPN